MLDLLISPFARIIGIIALVGALFGFGYYRGYSAEKERYEAFKALVAAQAQTQEIVNQNTKKKQEIIAESVKNEYQAKLAAVRSYYGGLRSSSTNSLPNLSNSTKGSITATSDPVFVGQCAETTVMLVSLQDWAKAVSSEK